MPPPRAVLLAALLLAALLASPSGVAGGAEVLAKSRLELCERDSGGAGPRLSCAQKLVLNLAVPSGSVSAFDLQLYSRTRPLVRPPLADRILRSILRFLIGGCGGGCRAAGRRRW